MGERKRNKQDVKYTPFGDLLFANRTCCGRFFLQILFNAESENHDTSTTFFRKKKKYLIVNAE